MQKQEQMHILHGITLLVAWAMNKQSIEVKDYCILQINIICSREYTL